MRNWFIILLSIAVSAYNIATVYAQPPPLQQCIGGKSIFSVSGDSLSSFRYSITGGVFLDTGNHDSIVVQWGTSSGLYKIAAQEIAFGGCEGEWVSIDVELKEKPHQFTDLEYALCPGDTLHLNFDVSMYENIRRIDCDIGSTGIVQPGKYPIIIEDLTGCKYTETISVVICDLPPIEKTKNSKP